MANRATVVLPNENFHCGACAYSSKLLNRMNIFTCCVQEIDYIVCCYRQSILRIVYTYSDTLTTKDSTCIFISPAPPSDYGGGISKVSFKTMVIASKERDDLLEIYTQICYNIMFIPQAQIVSQAHIPLCIIIGVEI